MHLGDKEKDLEDTVTVIARANEEKKNAWKVS